MARRCENCKFVVEVEQTVQNAPPLVYICHGGPPQAVLNPDGTHTFLFPHVNPTKFWCAKHRYRLGKMQTG